jgi:hypothetical protein
MNTIRISSLTIFMALIIACGGSTETKTATQPTAPETKTATQPQTLETKTTAKDGVNIVTDTAFDPFSWGQDLEEVSDDNGCADRTTLFSDKLTTQARLNLEVIFNKNIDQINSGDIKQKTSLNLSNMYEGVEGLEGVSFYTFDQDDVPFTELSSWDGIEYLTCLQYLVLETPYSRDLRFLQNLSEIRYLNLGGSIEVRVDFLQAMTKIEYLALPADFKQLPELAQFSSLKKIYAPFAKACNIEPLLAMPNLEELYLQGSMYQNSLKLQENKMVYPFDLSVDLTSRYLQLLAKGGTKQFNAEPDFDLEDNTVGIGEEGTHYNHRYMMEVMQSIYKIVPDIFDVVVFVGNEEEAFATYDGEATQISNNVTGLGPPQWSMADCYGSNDRLRGFVTFPSTISLLDGGSSTAMWYSAFTHEILHLWGGGYILPYAENKSGTMTGGHWEYTSADGILGGFNGDTLEEIEDDVYRVDIFGGNGNPEIDRLMSPLELYTMGVLPADQVPATSIMHGVSQIEKPNGEIDGTCEQYGIETLEVMCFKATSKDVVTIDYIEKLFGTRPFEKTAEISMLVVAVSEDPLTDIEWLSIDDRISWLTNNEPSTNANSAKITAYEGSATRSSCTLPDGKIVEESWMGMGEVGTDSLMCIWYCVGGTISGIPEECPQLTKTIAQTLETIEPEPKTNKKVQPNNFFEASGGTIQIKRPVLKKE